MGKDPASDVSDVFESHSVEVNSGLLFQPMHYRIPEAPLVPEVAVHRSLVHPRLLGHTSHGKSAPVPN